MWPVTQFFVTVTKIWCHSSFFLKLTKKRIVIKNCYFSGQLLALTSRSNRKQPKGSCSSFHRLWSNSWFGCLELKLIRLDKMGHVWTALILSTTCNIFLTTFSGQIRIDELINAVRSKHLDLHPFFRASVIWSLKRLIKPKTIGQKWFVGFWSLLHSLNQEFY